MSDRVVLLWTDEADALLRRLWGEGLSTARIGQAMGRTKNAVVGRVHRLRLPSRPNPVQQPKKPRRMPRGAAALAQAKRNSEMARAATPRVYARQGGGLASAHSHPLVLPAAQPIAAGASPVADPGRSGPAGKATASLASGVFLPDLPPALAQPRPAVFSGMRRCRWPLWADDARPSHEYCGEAIARGAYCAAHGALAYTGRALDAGPVPAMGRTNGWGA